MSETIRKIPEYVMTPSGPPQMQDVWLALQGQLAFLRGEPLNPNLYGPAWRKGWQEQLMAKARAEKADRHPRRV